VSAYVATIAQQLHGLTEMLVALVVPVLPPEPLDPAAPCSHPAEKRLPFGSLRHPRRSFCRQCSAFLEE
jgi:hypothetical protein